MPQPFRFTGTHLDPCLRRVGPHLRPPAPRDHPLRRRRPVDNIQFTGVISALGWLKGVGQALKPSSGTAVPCNTSSS